LLSQENDYVQNDIKNETQRISDYD